MPYFLGASIAYQKLELFNLKFFLLGLSGLVFVLIGVEAFNEYFDWILGTDRIFQIDQKPIGKKKFYIGIAAFFAALLFAVYLTLIIGKGIAIFALIGFAAAASYLGPPVKFAYRGLGEAVIALAYGPAMVLGSYYLQTKTVDTEPLLISILPAILLYSIAIINEVPDFLQDSLVGKQNICVRLGRIGAVRLYAGLLGLFFAAALALIALRKIPLTVGVTFFLIPLGFYNYRKACKYFEAPADFYPVIRGTLLFYIIAMVICILSIIFRPF
ncbi:MAG: prenyltransferase [Deltaproteobacteria bacterium]|nr:prenyltransferase [Deltaproteobacteria bacterium]